MYWRVKGTVIFTTDARRRGFMNNLVAFLGQAGITVRVDNRTEYEDPLGPACYVDICVEDDGQMDALWTQITGWTKNYLVKMDVVKHRCRADFSENPPPPDEPTVNIYYRYP